MIAEDEEPKEAQAVEDEVESSDSSESAYQALILAALDTPAPSRTRAGRARAAAMGATVECS